MLQNLRRAKVELIAKNPSLMVSLLSLHSSSLSETETQPQNPSLLSSLQALYPSSPSQNPLKPISRSHLRALVHNLRSDGKFSDLVRNVVSLPSVLFTACQSIAATDEPEALALSSVSKLLSVDEMGREIFEDRFDVESCCVKIEPLDSEGEHLVLPNLKLKVLIEAIRMVLEIVYEDKFAWFSHGGRVGMGRHTAIHYLKNAVPNPTWWFSVLFEHGKFSKENVDKLCFIIGDEVSDQLLDGLIKRLFKSEAVGIRFGGCFFGRGFPQESKLSSILLNIFLTGFDRKIHETMLKVNQQNPQFKSSVVDPKDYAFIKRLNIYVVRYLDEILVITSGSKDFTLDLKDRTVMYLERRLGLKVDKVKTVVHSAVSEKIVFMAMELQAVPPSVLHPPMTPQAIRALKKHFRRQEVRALEFRNYRERTRKAMGMEIMNYLFERFKSGARFKSEYRIEGDVRKLFRAWGDEVVDTFMGSLEERYPWHRLLTAGEFLSSRHIREMLPVELIDSYDKFQEQVEKHLSPAKLMKQLKDKERRKEEEEERRYAKKTIDDLTRVCMRVEAPIELIRKAVRLVGFTNNMGRPRPLSILYALEDADIIKWYAGIGRRWLNFYCCCHNFRKVQTQVSYHLRFSCILTLKDKHESTKFQAIRNFSKDLKMLDEFGNTEVQFPSEREVRRMGNKYLYDPKPVDGTLTLVMIRLASDEPPYCCIAHFCERTDTTVYRLRLLQKRLSVSPLDYKMWVRGIGAIHDSVHRKCLPLCPEHAHELYMGRITLQHIDCTSFVDVD